MNLNDKCCNILGQRSEIQSELDRLAGVIDELHTIIHGPDSLLPADPDTLLTAVRGLVAPEWISADLVRPTEPGVYWVLWSDGETVAPYHLIHFEDSGGCWAGSGDQYVGFVGTHYIKIKQPVAK